MVNVFLQKNLPFLRNLKRKDKKRSYSEPSSLVNSYKPEKCMPFNEGDY
jgi:hypothetical protein